MFCRFDEEYPALINIIRDPVNRLISSFYYMKELHKIRPDIPSKKIDMVSNRSVSKRYVSNRYVSNRYVSNCYVSNRYVSSRYVSNRYVSNRYVSNLFFCDFDIFMAALDAQQIYMTTKYIFFYLFLIKSCSVFLSKS